MWKVIYIVPTEEAAKQIKELLVRNGFLSKVTLIGSKHNGGVGTWEISVPVSEAEDAYEVLCENKFLG